MGCLPPAASHRALSASSLPVLWTGAPRGRAGRGGQRRGQGVAGGAGRAEGATLTCGSYRRSALWPPGGRTTPARRVSLGSSLRGGAGREASAGRQREWRRRARAAGDVCAPAYAFAESWHLSKAFCLRRKKSAAQRSMGAAVWASAERADAIIKNRGHNSLVPTFFNALGDSDSGAFRCRHLGRRKRS